MQWKKKNLQFLSERSSTDFTELILNVLLLDAQHLTDTPGTPLFIFILEKDYLKLYST